MRGFHVAQSLKNRQDPAVEKVIGGLPKAVCLYAGMHVSKFVFLMGVWAFSLGLCPVKFLWDNETITLYNIIMSGQRYTVSLEMYW